MSVYGYMYSPYLLNESPKDLALALGQNVVNPKRDGVELAGFGFQLDGLYVWTSEMMDPRVLRSYSYRIRFARRKRAKMKLKLLYRRTFNGYDIYSEVPMDFRVSAPDSKGQSYVDVRGASEEASSAMRTARTRVAGRIKSSRPKYYRTRQPTNLRPSPEIINRQFLKVTEVGSFGSLQPAQSGRTVVPILSYRRDWTGTRTPGFGTKAVRRLPVNPHDVTLTEVMDDRYTYYQVNTLTGEHSLVHTHYSDIYSVPDYPAGFFDSSLDQADNKAKKRLTDEANAGVQANVAQSLAQLSQTTSMIAKNTLSLRQALNHTRRGNFRQAWDSLTAGRERSTKYYNGGRPDRKKDTASNWLEFQYGWKPLLSDIRESFETGRRLLTDPNLSVLRVTKSGRVQNELVVDYPPGNGNIGESNHGKTTHVWATTVRYGISYRLDNPALAFFNQLGFTNPINLAWEILPFSFVADWFLPIGPALESLTAFQGLTFLDGYKTTFTKVKVDSAISYGGPVVGVPQTLINFGASYRREKIFLSRVRLTAFPGPIVPTLNVNPFRNSGIASDTDNRAANGIALLFQAFK